MLYDLLSRAPLNGLLIRSSSIVIIYPGTQSTRLGFSYVSSLCYVWWVETVYRTKTTLNSCWRIRPVYVWLCVSVWMNLCQLMLVCAVTCHCWCLPIDQQPVQRFTNTILVMFRCVYIMLRSLDKSRYTRLISLSDDGQTKDVQPSVLSPVQLCLASCSHARKHAWWNAQKSIE